MVAWKSNIGLLKKIKKCEVNTYTGFARKIKSTTARCVLTTRTDHRVISFRLALQFSDHPTVFSHDCLPLAHKFSTRASLLDPPIISARPSVFGFRPYHQLRNRWRILRGSPRGTKTHGFCKKIKTTMALCSALLPRDKLLHGTTFAGRGPRQFLG
jgi:hypothetical protein